MSADHYRKELHTFSDEGSNIFTVTNSPPIIPHIATTIEPATLSCSSMGSLRRPLLAVGLFPELPFLLRTLPVDDPLLSRLSVNPESLSPVQYDGGWALADDLRYAWITLEKGLVYVSDLLLAFPEQSSCGTSAAHAIVSQPHWPHPEDFGYRNLHRSARAAGLSIRRAHQAFQMLIARCTLAVAVWLFPGPRDGHVMEARSSHYNYATDETIPDWVAFLIQKNVPSSWIDALRDSIINDFSFDLRVGTLLDSKSQTWLPVLPVLRAANIPVFVWWHSRADTMSCLAALPYMRPFAPLSPEDVHLALQHLPSGRPRIVTLCRAGQLRPCPDFNSVDETNPPFGPYQLPQESRIDFFTRRERYRPDQQRRETQVQINRRLARTLHAQTGSPPYRRTRVYLWVKAEILFPDLPVRWHGTDYRHTIPPSAYRSLWMVHPAGFRHYNPYFDEWDLWFPPDWELSTGDTLEGRLDDNSSTKDPSQQPRALSVACSSPSDTQDLLHDLRADTSLLFAQDDYEIKGDDDINDVYFPPNYLLACWYGISISDNRTFPEVDHQTWVKRLPQIFSEQAANISHDAEQQSVIAGWVSAMLAGDLRSRALMHSWDLDTRNPSFLLRDGAVRSCISLEHMRTPPSVEEIDNVVRWVRVDFKQDPESLTWSVLTTPMGALWLARRLTEVDTSQNAVLALVSAGIPVRTGQLMKGPAHPALQISLAFKRRMLAPWRKKGERPTILDYDSYCQRVLELAMRPHARAAWLKGGIVGRILRQVTGRDLLIGEVGDVSGGPSEQASQHPITVETNGEAYYDDGLSLEELDIVAGVVKVYTGIRSQTEDVSWWPKHSAWVRGGGYTGIWTSWQEHWFQERLQGIRAGREGPLNASEWKDKLRGFKKAGQLADRVEKASWEFTFRHFIQPEGSAERVRMIPAMEESLY